MKSEYKLTRDDFRNGLKIHMLVPKVKVYAAIIATFWIGGFLWFGSERALTFGVLITMWMVVVGVVSFYFALYKGARIYDENAECQSSIAMELMNNELSIKSDKSQTLLPAERVFKVRVSPAYYLIYINSLLFYLVPKAVLDENVELRDWLNNADFKLPPHKRVR